MNKNPEHIAQKIALKEASGIDSTKDVEAGLSILCSLPDDATANDEINAFCKNIDKVILEYTKETYAGVLLHKYELICKASIQVLHEFRDNRTYRILNLLLALDVERTFLHKQMFSSCAADDCSFFTENTYHLLPQKIGQTDINQWIEDWSGLFSIMLQNIQSLEMEEVNSSIMISMIFVLDINRIARSGCLHH